MDTFNPSQMPPMGVPTSSRSNGPLIAVIVILALIIVGGLYFLKERTMKSNYLPPTEEQTEQEDGTTASLKQQSDSDDLNSIEADLKATDLDNFDQGAAAIEAELQ